MTTYLLIEDERWPDFDLIKSEGPVGRVKEKSGKGWIMRTRIELSDAEFADWQRTQAAYNAWINRLEDAARKPKA